VIKILLLKVLIGFSIVKPDISEWTDHEPFKSIDQCMEYANSLKRAAVQLLWEKTPIPTTVAICAEYENDGIIIKKSAMKVLN
jgi:hypothetical protein